jgi:uncharacterized protein with von Willebrand factor type A (vWA) domain
VIEDDPKPPEPRVFVGIRLRPSSIKRIEKAAKALGITKSEALRRAFAAGLPQVEAQATHPKL